METQNLCDIAKSLINGVGTIGTVEAQQTIFGKPFPLVITPVNGDHPTFIQL